MQQLRTARFRLIAPCAAVILLQLLLAEQIIALIRRIVGIQQRGQEDIEILTLRHRQLIRIDIEGRRELLGQIPLLLRRDRLRLRIDDVVGDDRLGDHFAIAVIDLSPRRRGRLGHRVVALCLRGIFFMAEHLNLKQAQKDGAEQHADHDGKHHQPLRHDTGEIHRVIELVAGASHLVQIKFPKRIWNHLTTTCSPLYRMDRRLSIPASDFFSVSAAVHIGQNTAAFRRKRPKSKTMRQIFMTW